MTDLEYAERAVEHLEGLEREHAQRLVVKLGKTVILRYEHPTNEDDIRVATVPIEPADRISQDTYRSIATQCRAGDFGEKCKWIERNDS